MRESYSAFWYDARGRLTDSVDGGSVGFARGDTPPERSEALLRVSRHCNDAGLVDVVTDPRGNESRTWYDALGRTTKVIEGYVDGVPGDDDDRTTLYTYATAMMRRDTITAVLPGAAAQATDYVYGARRGVEGSRVSSNDLRTATVYPHEDNGQALEGASPRESLAYNALGEPIRFTDRNGTVHEYGHDMVGRRTVDAATALAAGVDGAVRRMVTEYDALGRPTLISSFASPKAQQGETPVNQIKRAYAEFGQLADEWQAHTGSVNVETTPKVHFEYDGDHAGQVVSMTYPNGRELHYLYNGSALDGAIGRLSAISASASLNDALERYEYLGLGFVVTRQRPEIGIELTYVKQGGEPNGDGGDQLIGLDRFGRVVDQRWIEGGTATDVDRFQLGHDANGNLKFIDNRSLPQRSQLFNNGGPADRLNRLSAFARGELSAQRGGIVGEPLRTQSWDLDALGNFQSVSTNGAAVSRAHNLQNQVTAVGSATLSYDGNGNAQVDEQGRKLVFDAWNRLVSVKTSGGTLLSAYGYDAAGRRIQETHGQSTRELYYSPAWQVIEEREGGDVKAQYVWSAVYVDAMVLRDVDADGSSGTGDLGKSGSGLEQRLYAQTDANFNVTSVVAAQSYLGDDKPTVVRGYVTPQAQPLNNQSVWAVWNGSTWAGKLADGRPFTGEYSSTDVEWKVDGTSVGVWSFADGEWSYESGGTGAYTFVPLEAGPGELMERMEYDPYGQVRFLDWDGEEKLDGQFGWTYLHQGGRYDASAGLYDFRNRQYSPTLGRWMSADPLGYVDGMNVYGYLGGNPVGAVDPMGTQDYTAVYANVMQNPRAYPPARYPGLWGPADNLAVSEDRWWKHVKEREAPDWQTASLDPGIGFGSEALHQITLTPGRAWKFVDSFFGGGKDFLISAIVVVSVDLPHVYFGAWSTETYLSSSPIVRYYKRHGAQGEWPVVPVAPEVRDFGRALVSSDRDVQGDAWAQLGFGTLTTAVMLKVPSASRPAGPAAEMSAAERAAVNVLYRDFLRPLDDVSAPGRLSPAIPQTFARVVPAHINPTTLGITEQVFVTDAALVRGLNAAQLAEMLEIPPSSSFPIIEFPSQGVSGIAVPIRNASPGFVGNGFTSGGLPEFVIPNGPIPPAAVVRKVR